MTRNHLHSAGTVLLLAEGDYSDYRTGAMLICLKNLDLRELAEQFYATVELDEYGERSADGSMFALWLTQNGWVTEKEHQVIHVGSYGTFECCGFKSRD